MKTQNRVRRKPTTATPQPQPGKTALPRKKRHATSSGPCPPDKTVGFQIPEKFCLAKHLLGDGKLSDPIRIPGQPGNECNQNSAAVLRFHCHGILYYHVDMDRGNFARLSAAALLCGQDVGSFISTFMASFVGSIIECSRQEGGAK